MEQQFFIGYHKDEKIIKKSSSGGIFTAITDLYLKSGNVSIYGCILDENLNATHIKAKNTETRNKMCGSKYIQSNISNCFNDVAQDLKNNVEVIFTGTPCQIAGLNSFLELKKIDKKKLLTVEVICHGVGSNKFFRDFISYLEKKYNGKAIKCNFRSKKRKGQLQCIEIIFDNGKVYTSPATSLDWFYSVYHKNYILRPSCYECKYATKKRNSDISIADSWSDLYNKNYSTSLIICNTQKGLETFNKIKSNLIFKSVTFDQVEVPQMKYPSKKPHNYNEFWNIYNKKGYLEIQKYLGNNTKKSKLKSSIVNILNKFNLIYYFKILKSRGKNIWKK